MERKCTWQTKQNENRQRRTSEKTPAEQLKLQKQKHKTNIIKYMLTEIETKATGQSCEGEKTSETTSKMRDFTNRSPFELLQI